MSGHGYFMAKAQLTRQGGAEKREYRTYFSGEDSFSGEIGFSGELTLALALAPSPQLNLPQ